MTDLSQDNDLAQIVYVLISLILVEYYKNAVLEQSLFSSQSNDQVTSHSIAIQVTFGP